MSYRNTRKQRDQVPLRSKGGPDPQQPLKKEEERKPPAKHVNQFLSRTTQYKPPGSDEVGLGPKNQPSKVVWELDYGLSETQFKALSSRFPGIAFVQTGFDCHDHPIAHTSYRVVWENVTRKLKPGQLVADVGGNPAFNEQFNKRQAKRQRPIQIDSFVKVQSTKDSIRQKVRWGPPVTDGGVKRWEEMTLYDMYRNDENRERFAKYDVFLMNHVLYYYKMEEINKLLNLNPNSVLYATLHKVPGQNGTINCGEQEYTKDLQTGRVRQVNVETGEYYEHDDPAPWFQRFAFADENGAMAWTINKGCDDTYVITATSTIPGLVSEECWKDGHIVLTNASGQRAECTIRVVDDPPPAYPVEDVVIKTNDIIPGYQLVKEKHVRITHPELYETLKTFMINKPRNVRTLQDLTAKAHREAGNNTLAGNNKRIKISAAALTEHVFAAWVSGAELEHHLYAAVTANSQVVAHVNRNLANKSLSLGPSNVAKQAVRAALGLNAIIRSKEPVEAVLRHVDDLL